jgi:hypothetical protein
MPFGFFFGFDLLAEFFVFSVFGFAVLAFAFLVDFFDLHRFVLALVLGFGVICFYFVVFKGAEGHPHCGPREGGRVGRGGCGQQHQRGEQEDEQDRELPHAPLIGALGIAP